MSDARFQTTRWSLVRAAQGRSSEESRLALSDLCKCYLSPLLAHARRLSGTREEAEDLVQGFFADLLGRGDLDQVRPENGRLRSFLLASLEHFASHERQRTRAAKRGGGRLVSFESLREQVGDAIEPRHDLSPHDEYEHAWALTVLSLTRARLKAELDAAGKSRHFELLAPVLTGGEPARSYREIGAELALSENAVKAAVHRLRGRFADILRAEVRDTVEGEEQVDDELRHLFEVLSRGA